MLDRGQLLVQMSRGPDGKAAHLTNCTRLPLLTAAVLFDPSPQRQSWEPRRGRVQSKLKPEMTEFTYK